LIVPLLLPLILAFSSGAEYSEQFREVLRRWSDTQIKQLEKARQKQQLNSIVSSSPMELIMLEEDSYPYAKCLDGSQFGYYLRKAPETSPNSKKWVIFLQGGGLCVEPIDCLVRQEGDEGSSKPWPQHWSSDTDGAGDITYDDPKLNPNFYDYNHVYLRYCTGDLWTGGRTHAWADGTFWEGFWFMGHHVIEGTMDHLNKTAGLQDATHVLLMGSSAGGSGTYNNADFMREKWLKPGVYFRAAPVSGMFFPTTTDFVPYEEWVLGLKEPLNSVASFYLTSWYGSTLDESCVSNSDEAHRCWDASYLYNYVDSSMFLVQNQFDQLQVEDLLLCPCSQINVASTRHFIAHFGETVLDGYNSSFNSTRGLAKGDGAFMPSCYVHTEDFCIRGGPRINHNGNDIKLSEILGKWFNEGDPAKASTYQLVEDCGDMPCNTKCMCD